MVNPLTHRKVLKATVTMGETTVIDANAGPEVMEQVGQELGFDEQKRRILGG
jgi:hypothetical protein